jgi:hypothetical protein
LNRRSRRPGEKPRSGRAGALDRFRDTVRQVDGAAGVRLEHHAQRTTLAVERRQELRTALWRSQHTSDETLE